MTMAWLLVLFLANIVTTFSEGSIHPLRPQSGAGGGHVPGLSCLSWRLSVETNNIIGWKHVPKECKGYVGDYMLGGQYRSDSKAVADEAYLYAKSLTLGKDGKDVWIFDVDETSLCNLAFMAHHGFGAEPGNITLANRWIMEAKAPALPETLGLYKKLLHLGIKPIFLTGRAEDKRNATATNLRRAGYYTWEKLVLKDSSYSGKYSAIEYKPNERKKLEKEGYRIVGNIGDQWSDLLGTNTGNRTFKLPNPMYYVS